MSIISSIIMNMMITVKIIIFVFTYFYHIITDEKTVDELFVKKEVKPITGRRHSALSELIKQSTARFASHSNAFDEYKQFNAEVNTDRINIIPIGYFLLLLSRLHIVILCTGLWRPDWDAGAN